MSWALVLGGAGTPGLAWQTGLLAGLHAGGADLARPDLIVGSSAGAIAAARMACGLPFDAAFARELEPAAAALRDAAGLSQAADELRRELAGREPWPDRPLQIASLEAGTGTLVALTRSGGVPLADAVASSCAMPPWATHAELAFGHRLVVVIAASDPHGPLDDEIAQLRAGGSHVRPVFPDDASWHAIARNLPTATRAAAAEAGYAQGTAMAPVVGGWLSARHGLLPEVDVEDLAARFAVPSLRRAEWTHVAHLAVGAWHVHRYGAPEALARVRAGIRRLNVSIGGANTETSGYHESITAAYVTLLAAFLETCPPGLPLSECLVRLWATPLAERDILLTFYTRERLFSVEARARWVEPDLAPLRFDAVMERS